MVVVAAVVPVLVVVAAVLVRVPAAAAQEAVRDQGQDRGLLSVPDLQPP